MFLGDDWVFLIQIISLFVSGIAMGEFRRQPSKVWWSTYEDEDLSRYSGFLDWGKSVDLSANFTEGFKNNLSETKNNLNSSKVEKSETFAESNSIKSEASKTENVEENEREADRKSLENDRGSSSSPSQGSHKSQDSGFSDSEIQNNGLSLSPECSPEISSRVSCVKCKSREESSTEQVEISQKEKSYNETVANYRKLKTSVKTTAPQYKVVEFNSDNQKSEEKHFLETDFNGYDECAKNETKDGFQGKTGSSGFKLSSPKHKNHKSILKSHILRTKCETREKINHIQNQLELSFKLPKKINLPQNLKISNVFHAKPLIEVKSSKVSADRAIKSTPNSTENLTSFKSLSCVQIPPKKIPLTNLDNEGFKVPKLPSEHSFHCKGSSQLLDFTDIEGPPISSSTPKSNKFQGRESPVPKTARATEKISTAKTTFATVRKLKGLSEKKLKGSKILLESFNR